jgi:hypothetical protein
MNRVTTSSPSAAVELGAGVRRDRSRADGGAAFDAAMSGFSKGGNVRETKEHESKPQTGIRTAPSLTQASRGIGQALRATDESPKEPDVDALGILDGQAVSPAETFARDPAPETSAVLADPSAIVPGAPVMRLVEVPAPHPAGDLLLDRGTVSDRTESPAGKAETQLTAKADETSRQAAAASKLSLNPASHVDPGASSVTVLAREQHLMPGRAPDILPPRLHPAADRAAIRIEGEGVALVENDAEAHAATGDAGDEGEKDGSAKEQDGRPVLKDRSHASAASASAEPERVEKTVQPQPGAPLPGASVIPRIAEAIVSSASQATAAPATEPQAGTAQAEPTKVMTVHIDLKDRGAVHLRMALTGASLSLQLRADDEKLAEEIRQDSEELTDMLRSAGYEADSVSVEVRKADAPPGDAQTRGASADTRQQPGSTGSNPDRQHPQPRNAPPFASEGEPSTNIDGEQHAPGSRATRPSHALYI